MGIVCGIAGAMLYVPFYRLGATSVPQTGTPVPPFTPVIDWARTDTMALAVAIALLLAEALLLLQMTRSRIFEELGPRLIQLRDRLFAATGGSF